MLIVTFFLKDSTKSAVRAAGYCEGHEYPFVSVGIEGGGNEISIYGETPEQLRALASTLNQAADELEKWGQCDACGEWASELTTGMPQNVGLEGDFCNRCLNRENEVAP